MSLSSDPVDFVVVDRDNIGVFVPVPKTCTGATITMGESVAFARKSSATEYAKVLMEHNAMVVEVDIMYSNLSATVTRRRAGTDQAGVIE
jgi:hypothetical protein